jgi:hypothetical protein
MGPYVRAQGIGYNPFDMASSHHPPPVEVTPCDVILFTKGVYRLCSCRTSSGLCSSGEIERLGSPFIDLYVQELTTRLKLL